MTSDYTPRSPARQTGHRFGGKKPLAKGGNLFAERCIVARLTSPITGGTSGRIKAVKRDEVRGPNGERLMVSWFADKRIRVDFYGDCVITKVFPKPKAPTNIELKYDAP